MDNLRDTFTRESFLPESTLDVVEDARVRRVGLVQNIFQTQVRRPKTVTEVLSKDPTAVY